MNEIFHALVLNMHQPPSNLDDLLDTNPWEVKEILFAYDRMPRTLWSYEDLARVHVSFSGTLLETLCDPNFQRRVYGSVDCGSLLWSLQNTKIFEILGTGYYHPVLALIPEADWDEHIARWQALARHVFWRNRFAGFWPPEMGFDERLIPHLKKAGYRYVMVDCEYIDPVDSMSWQELRYRPHIASYDGEEIVVVARDRDLSNAQLSGMDHDWFLSEMVERTRWCDFPPLVATVSDGDNGGWFRNVNPLANFWNYFYQRELDEIRAGNSPLRPTFIDNYLDRFGAHGRVTVRRGAWNTDTHHGWDFHQWQGGQAQRDALARIYEVSAEYHRLADRAKGAWGELERVLREAHWHLLRAETSCNLYWGDAWVWKTHKDLDDVAWHLGEARAILGPEPEPVPESPLPESASESQPASEQQADSAATVGEAVPGAGEAGRTPAPAPETVVPSSHPATTPVS